MQKLIITVAVNGSLTTRAKTKHVPISPQQVIETAKLCEQAGASIIHIHARDPIDESASTDFELFQEMHQGLLKETNLIVQISTGGRAGMAYEDRAERLSLKPEMASLTTGSVNFPDSVYANSPDLIEHLAKDMKTYHIKPEIEVFDVSMIQNAQALVDADLIEPNMHFDFVMGLKGAMPATIENLVFLKNSIPASSTWCVAGMGAAQLPMNVHAILMGGHVRVGLEDNVYLSRGEKAPNEDFVARIAKIANQFGREVASPDEARKILGL